MKPIIGILAEIDDEKTVKIQDTYVKTVECLGGIPIVIPYTDNESTLTKFTDICDGFIFTGGADVDPKHYGEEKKETCGVIQQYRDDLELRIFNVIIKKQKPIIAICRGIQIVNVALGGTLYQDIPTEKPSDIFHQQKEPKFAMSHDVEILKGTPLHSLIGAERMQANSFHHQAIKTLGKDLEIMATADDGIIEAVYLKSDRYLRAYQWHPERIWAEDELNRRIFEDFISVCKA
ncbi:MAG: gamma-glutamyl-gamma-aminobutyrate hydrolase family protein [Ruminococcaceae bacterium]|nr:gamma-glutamyl-gamma-aminobutyrate hydrolase family protein [Oscillospiraceae bacterium]